MEGRSKGFWRADYDSFYLVLMASLPASPRGNIFPRYGGRYAEEHKNRRRRRTGIPCYKRASLAQPNLIKCSLATVQEMLMSVGRWRGKPLPHTRTNSVSFPFQLSLTHTRTHIEGKTLLLKCPQRNGTVLPFKGITHTHTLPPLFCTHTSTSSRVYHDDPCHKGEALNKTRVMGGGEDAKITKQLEWRP